MRTRVGVACDADRGAAVYVSAQRRSAVLARGGARDPEDKHDFTGQVLMRLWNDERDRVARISEAALCAGVQARALQLAEKYGEAIAKIMQAIFSDPELALSETQQEVVPISGGGT